MTTSSTPFFPQWQATLLCGLLGLVLFRAPDMATALGYYAGLFGQNGLAISSDLQWQITPLMLATLTLGCAIVALAPRINFQRWPLVWPPVFLLALSKLIDQTHTPFLYFQF